MILRILRRYLRILEKQELVQKCKLLTKHESAQVRPGATIKNRQNDPDKIRLGRLSVLDGEIMVMGWGGEVSIGDYSYVGERTKIWSGASIQIGDHVLISHNVNIIDTNSHHLNHLDRAAAFRELVESGPLVVNTGIVCGPIVIKDHAWINFNVAILKNVTIGTGSIIAPNSVVLSDVPDFCFYGGNPAKLIKRLSQ